MKKLSLSLFIIVLMVSSLRAGNEENPNHRGYFYGLGAWQRMNFSEVNTALGGEGFKPLFENRAYFGIGWDGLDKRYFSSFDFGFSPNQRLRDSSGVRFMNSSLAFFRFRSGWAVIQKEAWDLIPYIGVNFDVLTISQGLYQDSVTQWFRNPVPMNQTTAVRGSIEPGIQFSWMPGLKKKDSDVLDRSLRITLRAGYAIGAGNTNWYSNRRRLSGPDFTGGPFVTLTVGGLLRDN
jgi:hypothetical protein